MAFAKERRPEREEPFNLKNQNDLRVVKEFEKELEPYANRNVSIPNTSAAKAPLSGFELYCHEHGIYTFSKQYPFGAVSNPSEYRMAMKKWHALQMLRRNRRLAAEHEAERIGSLAE